MIPGLDLATGGGGFSGSSSASSDTGQIGFGPFNFQPKGGAPSVLWIAIAAVASVVLLTLLMRRR